MSDLPPIYGITAVALFPDLDSFFVRLDAALESGLRMLQVRDKQLEPLKRKELAQECVHRGRKYGCQVLINDDADLAQAVGAHGVHVSSARLETTKRGELPGLVGVSCHNAAQLRLGLQDLQADFAVLSPVLRTLTHVDAQPLGWDSFAELAREHDRPVYALGGLNDDDLPKAKENGAVGLASMRCVWGLDPRPAQQEEAA